MKGHVLLLREHLLAVQRGRGSRTAAGRAARRSAHFTEERKRLVGASGRGPHRRSRKAERHDNRMPCRGAAVSARAHPNSVASESTRGAEAAGTERTTPCRHRERTAQPGTHAEKREAGVLTDMQDRRPDNRRAGGPQRDRGRCPQRRELPEMKGTRESPGSHAGKLEPEREAPGPVPGDTERQGWGKRSLGISGEDEVLPSSSWL